VTVGAENEGGTGIQRDPGTALASVCWRHGTLRGGPLHASLTRPSTTRQKETLHSMPIQAFAEPGWA